MKLRVCVLSVLALAVNAPIATAAKIVKWQLVVDGSSDPPGDRLDYTVLLTGDEREPTLAVRPFLILGDNNDRSQPIDAKPDAPPSQKDLHGKCVVTVRLALHDKAAAAVSDNVVVPYAALGLKVGQHKIAYQVTLSWMAAGRPRSASAATAVTTVTLTDRKRVVAREKTVERVVMSSRTIAGHVVTDTKDKKVEVVQLSVATPQKVFAQLTTSANGNAAEIENEFRRTPANDPGPDPAKPPQDNERDALVRRPWVSSPKIFVYFATNRRDDRADATAPHAFGTGAAEGVTYGSASVSVPVAHKRGVLEEPAHWWTRRDPKDHFVIEGLKTLTKATLQDAAARKGDVLLFVHGYNNTFEDAIYRLAQVSYDLEFPGLALAFSWPSNGSLRKYDGDEEAAAGSAEAMAGVIGAILEKLPRGNRLHVIAHSMGNRVFLNGLAKYAVGGAAPPVGQRSIGHVLLAAPDVDAKRFAELYPIVDEWASTVSLYFNKNDYALKASHIKHLDLRVGEGPFFVPKLANIDAERADTSALGHGYYASESVILVDIELLLNQGLRPDKRVTLRARENALPKVTYWFFP